MADNVSAIDPMLALVKTDLAALSFIGSVMPQTSVQNLTVGPHCSKVGMTVTLWITGAEVGPGLLGAALAAVVVPLLLSLGLPDPELVPAVQSFQRGS